MPIMPTIPTIPTHNTNNIQAGEQLLRNPHCQAWAQTLPAHRCGKMTLLFPCLSNIYRKSFWDINADDIIGVTVPKISFTDISTFFSAIFFIVG